jgi:hypothetical protein
MFDLASRTGAGTANWTRAAGKLVFLGAVSLAATAAVVTVAERGRDGAPAPGAADRPGDAAPTPVAAPMQAATPVKDGPSRATEEEPSVRLLSYIATRSRMLAERDGSSRLKLPARFSNMSRRAVQIAANEQRLLDARRLSFESRQRDLRAKIDVVRDEIAGFDKQRLAKQKEIGLIKDELAAVERLHTKQLTNIARLLSLRREETRALYDIGSLDAAVARSHLTIKDIEAQIHDERHSLVVEAEKEIRIIDMEIGALITVPEDLSDDLVALAAGLTRDGRVR